MLQLVLLPCGFKKTISKPKLAVKANLSIPKEGTGIPLNRGNDDGRRRRGVNFLKRFEFV